MWKEGCLLKSVALIRLECWAWGWLGLAWGCLCHSILGRSEPEWMSPDSGHGHWWTSSLMGAASV